MNSGRPQTAIYYEEDAFVEDAPTYRGGKVEPTMGPVGRRVAGQEFLRAFVRFSRADPIMGLLRDRSQRETFSDFCRQPGLGLNQRQTQVLYVTDFHNNFFPEARASVIHYPTPIEPRFAWTRQYGGPTYAMSGITHTISSFGAMQVICDLVAAPFEPYDALVCISRAAVRTVREVTDNYCAYLRDRFGGSPQLRLNLVNIPLGVDTEKYRPPTPEERAAERAKHGIADDEIVVLYLGRLLHFGKVHPFPMFQGIVAGARAAGAKVRLIFTGWADPRVMETFESGAKVFAPGVTTMFLDGRSDDIRYKIWWAADVFAFPTDNIQETFPQSMIEAMACGLPIIASDWDGCRDQVIDGETGFLARSFTIPGATIDATSQLIIGQLSYYDFLARCNQSVAIDMQEVGHAMMLLCSKPELRQSMGHAARRRALDEFSWDKIIPRYEAMWAEQERLRQDYIRKTAGKPLPKHIAPAVFPPPEVSFASYPSSIASDGLKVQASVDAQRRLVTCMKHPLTGYAGSLRCRDMQILKRVLEEAKEIATIGQVEAAFLAQGVPSMIARATIIWMMKYAIIEPVPVAK